jgi:hypothetical protein
MSRASSSEARISGLVLEGHKDAAVEAPFDPAERFGIEPTALRRGRRGHRVRASTKSLRFETEIVPRSKRFWLVLPASVLEELRLEPGDTIDLSVGPVDSSEERAPSSAEPRKARALSPKRAARRSSSAASRRGG